MVQHYELIIVKFTKIALLEKYHLYVNCLIFTRISDQCCKDDSEDDNEVSTCRYPSLLPATPEEDSSSSEDERVYEGIVTVRDEMESHDSHVTQQDEYTKVRTSDCYLKIKEVAIFLFFVGSCYWQL